MVGRLTRLQALGAAAGHWFEDAGIPLLVFASFAIFSRGMPWILGVIARG